MHLDVFKVFRFLNVYITIRKKATGMQMLEFEMGCNRPDIVVCSAYFP